LKPPYSFIETSILVYRNPQIGWFIKENPKMKWMMWGYPYFRKPPLVGGFNPSEKY